MKLILKTCFLLFVCSIGFSSKGAQSEAYQSGQSFASSRAGTVTSAAKSTNPNTVPGFQTDKPKEASYNGETLSGDAIYAEVSKNEAAQHVISEAKERQSFKINPDTDPLFVEANQTILDPQKALQEEITEVPSSGEDREEVKVCEEAGDETLETVEEIRMVTVAEPKKHISSFHAYAHGWGGGLSRNVITGQKYDDSTTNTPCYAASTTLGNPLPAHLQSRFKSVQFSPGYSCPGGASLSPSGVMNISTGDGGGGLFGGGRGWFFVSFTTSLEITLKPGEEDVSEHIVGDCQYLEEKVEKGLCSYEQIIVTEGPQTRVINDYAVTRDWWRRKKIYRCHYPSLNNCEALRLKGCYQIKSTCKEKVKDTCVNWEQTYQCPSGKRAGKSYHSSNKNNPFCLTGNCADTSYQANGEMMEVMSQLSVLREAQNDLRNYQIIFKGNNRGCTRNCLDFRDCCGSGKGWGVSVGLSKCDEDEKELRKLRDKNLCAQVGTYCAEKKLGICIRKKTTFCCFGTKLARLIQENGRAQLGMSFGDPKSPDCNGFSAEQLSRIDFSRINFSELFADIKSQMVSKGQEQSLAHVSKDRLQGNMQILTKPSLDPQINKSIQELKEKGF